MKVQFASDLHLEMPRVSNELPLELVEADVRILAGDIHKHNRGIRYADELADMGGVPVIYVAGNHEYYRYEYFSTIQAMRDEAAKYPNVYFLENDSVVISGVRFLGCTLWVDFTGDGSISVERNILYADMLNDFRAIGYGERRMKPADQISLHTQSRKWLTEQLNTPFDGKTVVVTHHGPSRLTQHKNFEFDEVSACFLTKLDNLVEQADLWIYGHSHSNLDTNIGQCRLVSNQKGYPGERTPDHQRFDPSWVIEI